MTGNAFLPRLFVVQFILVVAVGYAFAHGWTVIAVGCVIAILAITLPVRGAYSHDPALANDGRIAGTLQGFSTIRAGLLYRSRNGTDVSETIAEVNEAEAAFRETIYYDGLYHYKEEG